MKDAGLKRTMISMFLVLHLNNSFKVMTKEKLLEQWYLVR